MTQTLKGEHLSNHLEMFVVVLYVTSDVEIKTTFAVFFFKKLLLADYNRGNKFALRETAATESWDYFSFFCIAAVQLKFLLCLKCRRRA